MTNAEDFLLIEKILQGDFSLYSRLVNRNRNMAFNLAYNIVLNREDAEEITQDAFVKAFTGLRSFNKDAKFSTWLYRIVVNTALNKKRLKKLDTIEIDAFPDEETANDMSGILDKYTREEQRKYIRLAIGSINENERLCITLYYLNELSIQEVSESTGISLSNIKVLLYRGRKKIYSKLQSLLKDEVKSLI